MKAPGSAPQRSATAPLEGLRARHYTPITPHLASTPRRGALSIWARSKGWDVAGKSLLRLILRGGAEPGSERYAAKHKELNGQKRDVHSSEPEAGCIKQECIPAVVPMVRKGRDQDHGHRNAGRNLQDVLLRLVRLSHRETSTGLDRLQAKLVLGVNAEEGHEPILPLGSARRIVERAEKVEGLSLSGVALAKGKAVRALSSRWPWTLPDRWTRGRAHRSLGHRADAVSHKRPQPLLIS